MISKCEIVIDFHWKHISSKMIMFSKVWQFKSKHCIYIFIKLSLNVASSSKLKTWWTFQKPLHTKHITEIECSHSTFLRNCVLIVNWWQWFESTVSGICAQRMHSPVSTADPQSHWSWLCAVWVSPSPSQLIPSHHFPLINKSVQFIMSRYEWATARCHQQTLLASLSWFSGVVSAGLAPTSHRVGEGPVWWRAAWGEGVLATYPHPPCPWRPHQALGFFVALHSCCLHNST